MDDHVYQEAVAIIQIDRPPVTLTGELKCLQDW